MNKVLNKKIPVRTKASAANLLLVAHMGEKCTLQFERQDEVFEGVLRLSSDCEVWNCGASFESHWLTAIKPNDDGSYTICVRIPDDEYAEMVAEFEEEQGEISFFRG